MSIDRVATADSLCAGMDCPTGRTRATAESILAKLTRGASAGHCRGAFARHIVFKCSVKARRCHEQIPPSPVTTYAASAVC